MHLVIVGDGPYLVEMQELMQGTPCIFTGYLEGEDLAAVYASSDLFLFPSTTDTFGNVVLEAQAAGIPVIVTDCGGPQENLIPGQTGLVVPANDPDSLAQAVLSLVAYPPHLKIMGQAARHYIENRPFAGAFNEAWQIYGEQ